MLVIREADDKSLDLEIRAAVYSGLPECQLELQSATSSQFTNWYARFINRFEEV